MTDLLILASEAEGIPADHIAAKLAVPIAIVIFAGSIFLLLWSNYGAKKGALIYAVATFGFTTMLGVFWWFGAPGTPVATGLQNFPGQAPDAYLGAWYPMEPGSDRASYFPATTAGFDQFQTIGEYVGRPDATEEQLEEDPMAAFIRGDLEQASSRMIAQFLPQDEFGGARLGATRRTELQEAAGPPEEGESRATPFFTAEVVESRVVEDAGHRVAAARLRMNANFVGNDGLRTVPVEEEVWYAFKDPGALWFPSAVWTVVSLLLFLLSMFALDRVEQREKRERAAVTEAEDVAVPVGQ